MYLTKMSSVDLFHCNYNCWALGVVRWGPLLHTSFNVTCVFHWMPFRKLWISMLTLKAGVLAENPAVVAGHVDRCSKYHLYLVGNNLIMNSTDLARNQWSVCLK